MRATDRNVLTVGHSTHPLEAFVALLQRHRAHAVADVRAAPYSRFNPQFNLLADGCLLCSEGTPDHCHRRLVAEYLDRHWGGVGITQLC